MFDDSEALELEAEDLIDTLDADDAAPAETAPLNASPIRRGTLTLPPIVAPTTIAPMQSDAAMQTLATATDRNKIVEALLGFSAATFQAAVVFTVRDNMAFGWKALGAVPGYANIEHVLIPLEAPSVLQSAIASETGVFHGPLAPSTRGGRCGSRLTPKWSTSVA